MNELKNIKILYIEDEEFIRQNAVEYLSYYCDNIFEAVDGLDGYEKYKKEEPDIIICDLIMPRLNGLELIEKIRKTDESTQILVTTARTDTDFLLKAVELGLVKYIVKPITENKLLPALREALDKIPKDDKYKIYLDENCFFDCLNNQLMQDDLVVDMTKKELLFLSLCAKNHKRMLGFSEIQENVWDSNMTEDALRSVVKSLRKRLPKNSLKSIPKMGFKLIVKNYD